MEPVLPGQSGDPWPAAVLERYHERFGDSLSAPVPVERIAEDDAGLSMVRGAPVMCRADEVGLGEGRALEWEANVFSAELLMPEPAIREEWKELGDVAVSAARFDVSPTAMHWRLYGQSLVPDHPMATQPGP
jgi:hypothetical protein